MAIALITNHSLPSCQTFSFDRLLHYNFYIWRSIAPWQALKSLHYLKKIQKSVFKMQYSYSLNSMHTLSRICKYTVQYSHKQTTTFWPPTLLKRSSPPLQATSVNTSWEQLPPQKRITSSAFPMRIQSPQLKSAPFGPNLSWSIMDQRNDLIFESKTDSLVFKVFCYVAPTAKFGKLPDPLHASTFLSKIAMIHYACNVCVYMYIFMCV